jgi:hypothetical protein
MSKLDRVKEKMLHLQETMRFHENCPADSPEKVANKKEIVACANSELRRVTAEYNELKIEADYHARTQYSQYGGSGDYRS